MSRFPRNSLLACTRREAFIISRITTGGQVRYAHLVLDGRARLTSFWTPSKPTGPATATKGTGTLLEKAGFIQHASKGFTKGFLHMLPLGLRVQEKIERLIDKHMRQIGASKVALSTVTTKSLWEKTGRMNKELFRIEESSDAEGLLLSPTHEEEITHLVANYEFSHRQVPLRLYQISRKYRHELRPRSYLLRAREFVMKDLYTFDIDEKNALTTYTSVVGAYNALFHELGVPFYMANADSGNMGGNLSHEFHFPSPHGEDELFICDNRDCDLVANEEILQRSQEAKAGSEEVREKVFVSIDRGTLVRVIIPKYLAIGAEGTKSKQRAELNPFALKRIYPRVDLSIAEGDKSKNAFHDQPQSNPSSSKSNLYIIDGSIATSQYKSSINLSQHDQLISTSPQTGAPLDLTRMQAGESCPKCHTGHLKKEQAIEVGHTFHLGDRYSKPLDASVRLSNNTLATMQMGCHGIGVSRLIGAIAAVCADEKGLRWPQVVAPFDAVIVFNTDNERMTAEAIRLYDELQACGDVALDDRHNSLGYKLKDADAVGYPFIITCGKAMEKNGKLEVQNRWTDETKNLDVDDVQKLLQAGTDMLEFWKSL